MKDTEKITNRVKIRSISERLRKQTERLTITEIARQTGISRCTLYRILEGQSFSLRVLMALEDWLAVQELPDAE